jgi:hypothetical protein
MPFEYFEMREAVLTVESVAFWQNTTNTPYDLLQPNSASQNVLMNGNQTHVNTKLNQSQCLYTLQQPSHSPLTLPLALPEES